MQVQSLLLHNMYVADTGNPMPATFTLIARVRTARRTPR